MRILLDTHTFLWFTTGDAKLSATAKKLIENTGNEKLLSVAVGWEIAIKSGLGKLTLAQSLFKLFDQPLREPDWNLLGIDLSHLAALEKLPHHHRDPFDRLLVAQSIIEDISLVSIDEALDDYGTGRLW